MAHLLYIEASPRKARSKSISVARAFLEKYQTVNPHHRITTIDLWQKKLPEFDNFTIDAKYQVMHGQDLHRTSKRLGRQLLIFATNSKRLTSI